MSAGDAADFVHLRVHSHYSLQDGLPHVDDLVQRAAELGMGALALTEQENLFSTVKFYQAAQKHGIKPIIGAELYYSDSIEEEPSTLVLLCQNQQGYQHLSELITHANRERGPRGISSVRKDCLCRWSGGLIALSGAGKGDVGRSLLSGKLDQARAQLEAWQELFPDRYYLELQRTGWAEEDLYLKRAVQLATEFSVPVVASNNVLFLRESDFDAHEARVCILSGQVLSDPKRPRRYSRQQYLRSAAEMQECFDDLPEALENSVQIARRCTLELDLGGTHMPEFQAPDGSEQTSYLRSEAEAGLVRRLETLHLPQNNAEAYQARLQEELKVIIEMGFSGYFLIVADFVCWARQEHIPVGPGRGSGGGSLVAYALNITELDPIAYDLLFERFLNPARISMPDFDIDFCMARRDEVIKYVVDRYGRDRVSQIITYGTMGAKAVVHDVGRILGHASGFADMIAKLIPNDLEITLEKALLETPALAERYQKDEEVRSLIDLAGKLEGTVRHPGRHAGGIVITPNPLTEYMPLYCEPDSVGTVTQFDMNDIEQVGLVKFDFLGLKTLTILDRTVSMVNQESARPDPLRIEEVRLDDPKVYRFIQTGKTTALFQLESTGMKRLIRRLLPERFEDLVALVALFRPGPLQSGMDQSYVDHKRQGQAEYEHASLEPILSSTWGVILYQEQVMQIARSLADYSLGEADLLRRAMGKKKPEEMAKHKYRFVDKAMEKGIQKGTAVRIFEQMEKFAGYGFNKSHSVGYALITYWAAWLKVHYPAYFMAAVLSEEAHTERLVELCAELPEMELQLLAPSINRSECGFIPEGEKGVRYGLGALRGIRHDALDVLLESRCEQGSFRDLFDLCQRANLRQFHRKSLETLILSGALDELEVVAGTSESGLSSEVSIRVRRSALQANLEQVIQVVQQLALEQESGQGSLFAGGGDEQKPSCQYQACEPCSELELLEGEREALGQYLSGHPLERYREELKGVVSANLLEVHPGALWVAGHIEKITTRRGQRGRVADLVLNDGIGRLSLIFYTKEFDRYRDRLGKARLIVVQGEAVLEDEQDACRVRVNECYDLQQLRSTFASLRLCVDAKANGERLLDDLSALLQSSQGDSQGDSQGNSQDNSQGNFQGNSQGGGSPVHIKYHGREATACLRLHDSWRVQISDTLLEDLKKVPGIREVQVEYHMQRGRQAAPRQRRKQA